MNKALLILSILFLSLGLQAQTEKYYSGEDRPNFYLGIGTGINTYTGLAGLSAHLVLKDKLFAQGSLGLSSWGVRSSLGVRYDRSYRNGITYGVNLVNSSGIDDVVLELETSNGDIRDLNLEMERTVTINLKSGYNLWIGEYNCFNFTLGYALAFKNQPWKVKDGTTLSPTSQQVMELIAPGGIILGLGFIFGIQ